ncbi:hypothetical protein [Longimicrobium sp.]|jgi:SAM-dependent methyltransferase|uniref:hypothetical protein n=1 Tax=Longimicrobium sp. TaxID=2029185 RepID=UPI002ED83035
MPLSSASLAQLETVVADAVWSSRNEAEKQGCLPLFHQELARASQELLKLSRGENCDYDLPRMGEAYALWYHMRRVSQIYEALEKFPQVATALEKGWADPWRVLDIGAGTGAGAMALSSWISHAHPSDAPQRTAIDCLEPSGQMISTGEKIVEQKQKSGLPLAQTRWLQGGIGAEADYAPDKYHLILCSTTFDYLEEDDWSRKVGEVTTFFNGRLKPGGCAIFLAPNRGFDGVQQGPKVRFVEELISKAGLVEYRRKVDIQPHKGTQTQILGIRKRLNQDARRACPDGGLGDGIPDYTTDTFSSGVYRPRSS